MSTLSGIATLPSVMEEVKFAVEFTMVVVVTTIIFVDAGSSDGLSDGISLGSRD